MIDLALAALAVIVAFVLGWFTGYLEGRHRGAMRVYEQLGREMKVRTRGMRGV